MRPTLALPLLALAALGLVLAPVVLADTDANESASDAQKADVKADKSDKAKEKALEKRAAKPAKADHARPAHVTAFVERMAEIRESWHENATKVREDCRSAAVKDNATDAKAYGQCIREGYRGLHMWYHAEMRAAKADLKVGHETWKAAHRAEKAGTHDEDDD